MAARLEDTIGTSMDTTATVMEKEPKIAPFMTGEALAWRERSQTRLRNASAAQATRQTRRASRGADAAAAAHPRESRRCGKIGATIDAADK